MLFQPNIGTVHELGSVQFFRAVTEFAQSCGEYLYTSAHARIPLLQVSVQLYGEQSGLG